MTERDARGPLPIDPTEPMATQSRHALMLADEHGFLTYRWPVDMRQPDQVQMLRDELGPDAQLPDADGVFYLVYVEYSYVAKRPGRPGRVGFDGRLPVLVPEGEVRPFVLALAAIRGPDSARRVQYMHGTLPV